MKVVFRGNPFIVQRIAHSGVARLGKRCIAFKEAIKFSRLINMIDMRER